MQSRKDKDERRRQQAAAHLASADKHTAKGNHDKARAQRTAAKTVLRRFKANKRRNTVAA